MDKHTFFFRNRRSVLALQSRLSRAIYPAPVRTLNMGFTLIEAMTTLAILALLVTFSAPGFSRWLAKNESKVIVHTLNSYILSARNAAISQNKTISFCGSDNHGECVENNPTHLQLFVDSNENKVLDDGEELLAYEALKIRGKLRLNQHKALKFQSNGQGYTPASFIYCPSANNASEIDRSLIQRIAINFVGRPVIVPPNNYGEVLSSQKTPISCNW